MLRIILQSDEYFFTINRQKKRPNKIYRSRSREKAAYYFSHKPFREMSLAQDLLKKFRYPEPRRAMLPISNVEKKVIFPGK